MSNPRCPTCRIFMECIRTGDGPTDGGEYKCVCCTGPNAKNCPHQVKPGDAVKTEISWCVWALVMTPFLLYFGRRYENPIYDEEQWSY
jgi:hypothetical protein